jgi:hypothetical protein
MLANVALGTGAPYSFSWLSDATTVSNTVSRLTGMVGVSAGMFPNANYPTSTTDGYRANSFDDVSLAGGGHNPDFLYHLPSAYVPTAATVCFHHLEELLLAIACALPHTRNAASRRTVPPAVLQVLVCA